jgi:hypothetical protein
MYRKLFGDYAILAQSFGLAPHGETHMQFERGKPPETPNAPYLAAHVKDERWCWVGPGCMSFRDRKHNMEPQPTPINVSSGKQQPRNTRLARRKGVELHSRTDDGMLSVAECSSQHAARSMLPGADTPFYD